MKYGITLPYGDARITADLAREAEQHGWDGVFVGDAIWCIDPLIQLAAAAQVTSRIRLGTMVLAMPLRRPWHLASESAALDILSGGRLILGLGMGATWMGWQGFPDMPGDARTRAELLDESIDILTLLYRREPFDYDGAHYHLKLSQVEQRHYPPPPVQQPRIPLWVVGAWPRMKSMRRVLKADGLLTLKLDPQNQPCPVTPADLAEMKAYINANRTTQGPFDLVAEGKTAGLSHPAMQDLLRPWIEAGATWWIESAWETPESQLRERIRQGPPALQ